MRPPPGSPRDGPGWPRGQRAGPATASTEAISNPGPEGSLWMSPAPSPDRHPAVSHGNTPRDDIEQSPAPPRNRETWNSILFGCYIRSLFSQRPPEHADWTPPGVRTREPRLGWLQRLNGGGREGELASRRWQGVSRGPSVHVTGTPQFLPRRLAEFRKNTRPGSPGASGKGREGTLTGRRPRPPAGPWGHFP